MATLQTISGSILIARAYYVELLSEYYSDLLVGKPDKHDEKRLICLNRLIRSLSWDVADGVNDSTTTQLYALLLQAIAPYPGGTLTVDPDVVIPTNPIVYDPSGEYRPPQILTSADFNGPIYTDPDLAGLNQFVVYLNGVRYLIPGEDFSYLPDGGLELVEPIYEGQQIILIF